ALPGDYKTTVPDTFYPELLVQYYDGFSKGPVCRDEGFTLYRALLLVQESLSQVMTASKSKVKDALLTMLRRPEVTGALGYYRVFWHKSRLCPLFALRFICLLCDFCEKTLTKAEYTAKIYNETTRRGLGVDKELRTHVRSLKCPAHTAASLAIPLPLDPLTFEGQLLITVAQSGSPGNVLHHPITGQVLLPDPSGLDNLPPASLLLPLSDNDDEEFEGPASPIEENDGPVSPVMDLDEDDDGETEVSEDVDVKDVFKAPKGKGKAKVPTRISTRKSPQVRLAKSASSKVGSPSAKRPVPKPIKRERSASLHVEDVEMHEPAAKRSKTTKETPPPQVADPTAVTKTKGSKSTAAEPHEPMEESEATLAHNDLDTTTHHALFLTNPNFQVKTAFADLVEQDSGVKRRPEMQILRSSPWTLDDELKELGAFLTTGGVSFSLENLGRFGHLVSRRMVHEDSDMAVPDPDLAPSLDCVSCQGCTQSHRTCPSSLHLELQSELLQDLPKSVQSLPGGYSLAIARFQTGLDRYFRTQELAQEMFNLAGYNLASLVRDLKVAGLDANVVLTAWAKEHPDEKLSYDNATLFATFFNWNSSCNLSAYLEKPEEIEKFQ
ncbi:hypothetical protein EV361DRAFT_984294, partial [Lentinula raphanica]